MFSRLFATQDRLKTNRPAEQKRRFVRRACDKCVTMINGKIYPVDNWSTGGVLINADSRLFGIDNEIDVIMKFKLSEDVMDVPHKARVIRKTQNKIALEFFPLSQHIHRQFQSVVDDYVTSQFVNSQLS